MLEQVHDAIRLKHYSIRTEEAYVNWVERYIYFHDVRHPAEMGAAEVEAFLTHLAVKENVAASTQYQALGALLFLYREVLHQDLGPVDALRAKRPKRLPTVLAKEETLPHRLPVGHASVDGQVDLWQRGRHQVRHPAGVDCAGGLNEAPHGADLLERFPVVGILVTEGDG